MQRHSSAPFSNSLQKLIACAILFLVHVAQAGGPPPKELTPDRIFKSYKDAVVRIEVSLHGASLGVGSGFFISASGEIATSLHVVRPLLAHPETEVQIKQANGATTRVVKVGACGDERGVDLCLLKVAMKPKSILKVETVEVTPGESVVAIGHPRGLDFSVSTGIVSAVRDHPSGWREVQVDAAISPGNSGGPIINKFGQAIGVVYQFERDGQNLNFGILVSEIKRLTSLGRPYSPLAESRRDLHERSNRTARRASEQWIKPAIENLTSTRFAPQTGLKWMRAALGDSPFYVLLPELFAACERSESEQDVQATTCSSTSGDLAVTIQRRRRTNGSPLSAYRGRRLLEPRPLSIVDRLEAEGFRSGRRLEERAFQLAPFDRALSVNERLRSKKRIF